MVHVSSGLASKMLLLFLQDLHCGIIPGKPVVFAHLKSERCADLKSGRRLRASDF
jgi:hypothetical protein